MTDAFSNPESTLAERFALDTVAPGLTTRVQETHDGPSSVDRLLTTVDAHAQAEAGSLANYARLRDSGDPVTALVLNLILEDEERHHTLLRRIGTSLHDALQWHVSADALPTGIEPMAAPADLAHTFKDLAQEEQSSVHHLQRVAHDLDNIHGGLDTLLLEMMAMDSQKHAHLLTFLQHRAEQQARAR